MLITGIYVHIRDLSATKDNNLKFVGFYGMGALAEELLSLFLFVGRSTGWSVGQSLFPKYLNVRHISHTVLTTPSLHSLNTDFRFEKVISCDKKVKQTLYRSEQALRVPAGLGSQTWRPSTHESSKVISPTLRPSLPYEIFLYSFPLAAEPTPDLQCGRKNYLNIKFLVTPSGMEPASFRLVAQCLNQLPHRVSHFPPLVSWIPNKVVSEHHVNWCAGRSEYGDVARQEGVQNGCGIHSAYLQRGNE